MKYYILLFCFSIGPTVATMAQVKAIRGKVVYRSCATIAVQVMDKRYFNLGQKSWRQAKNKPVYPNVFAVANQCTFPDYRPKKEFAFMIVKTDRANEGCNTCMLYDNTPVKKQLIKVVPLPGK